jgi:dipeptidyl aminopeptidase/acylaminoacyl peptidase
VPLNAEWLACSMITRGIHSLALVHLPTRTLRPMETPFRVISQLRAVDEHRVVFVGTRFDEPSALVLMDVSGAKKGAAPKWQVLKRSSDVVQNGTVPRDYLSQAQTVEFPTTLPDGSKSTAHAIVYPPLNPCYAAPTGAAPPAIILAHGGPTSAADAGLNLGVQFWTTRGFLGACRGMQRGSTSSQCAVSLQCQLRRQHRM